MGLGEPLSDGGSGCQRPWRQADWSGGRSRQGRCCCWKTSEGTSSAVMAKSKIHHWAALVNIWMRFRRCSGPADLWQMSLDRDSVSLHCELSLKTAKISLRYILRLKTPQTLHRSCVFQHHPSGSAVEKLTWPTHSDLQQQHLFLCSSLVYFFVGFSRPITNQQHRVQFLMSDVLYVWWSMYQLCHVL